MKKVFLTTYILSLLCLQVSFAQDEVLSVSELSDEMVGKEITLIAKIVQVKKAFYEDGSLKMVFFNLDNYYPDNLCTLQIFAKGVSTFQKALMFYEGKKVIVKGTLETYNERYQIVIWNEYQIRIVDE